MNRNKAGFSITDKYSNWVVTRPVHALLLAIVLTVFFGHGILQFQTSHDPRSFFGTGNPDLARFVDIETRYGARDLVMIALRPHDNDVFSNRTLAVIEELTQRSWEMPKSIRVSSLTNFQHTRVEGDEIYTEPLVDDALALSKSELQTIKAIALKEPTLLHSAVSVKGHVAGVLTGLAMEEGRASSPIIAQWARDLRDEFKLKYPDIDFFVSGTVIFNDAMSQATKDGFQRYLPLSLLASIILLAILLKSLTGMLFTVTTVVLSVLIALGLSSSLGIQFQPISSFSPLIILTIAIADCVHILSTFYQQQRLGLSKNKAMFESLRINAQPVMITSITTTIGFLGLNSSESPPYQDLGNIVSIGVIAAWMLSMLFLPAVVLLVPGGRVKPESNRMDKAMKIFSTWLIRNRLPVFAMTTVLMLGFAAMAPQNKFDDVWSQYFDESFDVRKANDFLGTNLTGMHRVELSFPAQNKGGVAEPEYLRKLDEFKHWVEAQPGVTYAASFSDVIKRLNRDMNEGDPTYYQVPDRRDLASQYMLLYEFSLPFGLGLDNQVAMDKDSTIFTVVLDRTTSANILAFGDSANDWIKMNMPDYMQTQSSGMDILFGGVAERNARSLVGGTVIALVLISLMIMIALRSVKYGLLSLLPNLLPAVVAFGIWGIIDGNIGLSVSIVGCLTLGIIVDDTVHFLLKYVRAKRENNYSTEQAVHHSFTTVGIALVSTSIVLVANFAVMSSANFYPTSSLGVLTSLTIVLALLIDFLFFAPLLLTLDKSPKQALQNT